MLEHISAFSGPSNYILSVLRHLFVAPLSLIVLICHSMAPNLALGQSDSGLTELQQKQVVDDAVQILGGNANVTVRWDNTIVFALVGGSEQAQVISQETILEVGDITNIPVELLQHDVTDAAQYLEHVTSTPEFRLDVCQTGENEICSNFVVVFAENQAMYELAEALPLRDFYARALKNAVDRKDPIPCFFSPFLIRDAEILQALVYVNSELQNDLLSTCIREEIYQSFGLFADVTDSRFFSFDNRVEPKEITFYDRALLKAVYDSSVGPGSPVFTVLKVFMENLSFDLYGELEKR